MVDVIILAALLHVVLVFRGYWWYKRGRIFFLSSPPCSLRACAQAMVLLLLFSNYWMLMSILILRPCLLLSVQVQIQDIKDVLSYTYSSNSSCHVLRSNFALLVTFLGRRSATIICSKNMWIFCRFLQLYQNNWANSTSSPVLPGCHPIFWQ